MRARAGPSARAERSADWSCKPRFRLRGLRLTGELALFAYMIPPILLLVPVARVVTGLGMANTSTALVLIYTSHLVPFALWILRAHFQAIPIELEHAAMVDGCT